MDPQFQNKEPKPGEGQPVGPADGQKVDPNNADFSKQYADYHTNKHPEPMTKEQQKAIHRHAEKVQRTTERANRDARDPMKQLDKQLKETIGHSLTELKAYQAETEKWRTEIDAMRDVYKLLIHERVTTRRRLKGGHTEGAMLNPETIAQTIMDVRSGSHYPPAFMDYERSRGERETSGKTAWVFVFDRSGSMQDGGRSVAAASSLVICLEGLAAMQRDIDTAEEEASADLDLGIQTAVYTFNGIIDCPKPLSAGLSEKERLDAYSLVSNPDGINADSVILGKIEDLKIQDGWRKVLVVVSDGEADDQSASKASIDLLRKSAWQVFGIAIGSKAAELLYAPDSQRVDNPTNLPQAMQTLVQKNLT